MEYVQAEGDPNPREAASVAYADGDGMTRYVLTAVRPGNISLWKAGAASQERGYCSCGIAWLKDVFQGPGMKQPACETRFKI